MPARFLMIFFAAWGFLTAGATAEVFDIVERPITTVYSRFEAKVKLGDVRGADEFELEFELRNTLPEPISVFGSGAVYGGIWVRMEGGVLEPGGLLPVKLVLSGRDIDRQIAAGRRITLSTVSHGKINIDLEFRVVAYANFEQNPMQVDSVEGRPKEPFLIPLVVSDDITPSELTFSTVPGNVIRFGSAKRYRPSAAKSFVPITLVGEAGELADSSIEVVLEAPNQKLERKTMTLSFRQHASIKLSPAFVSLRRNDRKSLVGSLLAIDKIAELELPNINDASKPTGKADTTMDNRRRLSVVATGIAEGFKCRIKTRPMSGTVARLEITLEPEEGTPIPSTPVPLTVNVRSEYSNSSSEINCLLISTD